MTFPQPIYPGYVRASAAPSLTYVGAAGSAGGSSTLTYTGFTLSAGLYCVFTAIRTYPSNNGVSSITVGGQSGATNFATGHRVAGDGLQSYTQGWYIRLTGSPSDVITITTASSGADVRRGGVAVYRIDGSNADAPSTSNTASGTGSPTMSAAVTLTATGCILCGAYASGATGGDRILAASANNVAGGTYTPQVAIATGGTGTWSGGVTADASQLLSSSAGDDSGLVVAAWC